MDQVTERQSPPIHDSDLIWLAIKRLEAVAVKMQKLEYDDELDQMMKVADEWFAWAAYNMNRRSGAVEVPTGEDNVDPFERAALIAETLQGSDGKPANAEQIAQALRAWKRLPVSETTEEQQEGKKS